MNRILTDVEIEALLREAKPLPANWSSRLRPRPKSRMAFLQCDLSLELPSGNQFTLILRRSRQSQLDFSVILVYVDKNGNEYRLRRHNGIHSSRHTNQWEKRHGIRDYQLGTVFHIHKATERYQIDSLEIDGFAEGTNAYNDFDGALRVMLRDGGFVAPEPSSDPGPQLQFPDFGR